jgi:uncharacterized protein YjbI with pentapeptide repeats
MSIFPTGHLRELLLWEIERTDSGGAPRNLPAGQPTAPLNLKEWSLIRDTLADLWDWWAEGVHLRPQPQHNKRQELILGQPFTQELVEWSMPLDYPRGAPPTSPPRIISADAHLGDALFCLTCIVHFQIAAKDGWISLSSDAPLRPRQLWQGATLAGDGPRRCQTAVKRNAKLFILFYPSGLSPTYFANYIGRINSAGWRPLGPFPLGLDLSGIDLRGTSLIIPIPTKRPRSTVNWSFANLSHTSICGSLFYRHKMNKIFMDSAQLWFCLMEGADLSEADLADVRFSNCSLHGSTFRLADLNDVHFSDTEVADAVFEEAHLRGVIGLKGELDFTPSRAHSRKRAKRH